jgi:hypothetical protein
MQAQIPVRKIKFTPNPQSFNEQVNQLKIRQLQCHYLGIECGYNRPYTI